MKRTLVLLLATVALVLGTGASAQANSGADARAVHIGCDLRTSNGTNSVIPYWMRAIDDGARFYIGSFRLSDECGSLNITVHGFRFHPTDASDFRFNYVNSDNEWVIGPWSNNHAAGQTIRLLATGSPGHPVNQRWSVDVRDHDAANRTATSWPWIDLSF